MGRTQEGEEGTGLSPHIQSNRPHHRAMARAYILGSQRPGELAKIFGFTVGHISHIIGSPCFQAEVQRLMQNAELISYDQRKELRAMQAKALENLDEELERIPEDHQDRKMRFDASMAVLGITGLSPKAGGVNININAGGPAAKEVKQLSDDELRDEITLCLGVDGSYE
jgi:hypothetical protein